MPDDIGAFLKASECFSALRVNITRVSYNKAVDSHTLFIDAEGTEEQLKKADIELEKKKAINEAKDEISDLAMAIAGKVVGRSLTDADHAQLVESFIDELGE